QVRHDGERDHALLAVAVRGGAAYWLAGGAGGEDDEVAVERDRMARERDRGLAAVAGDLGLVGRALEAGGGAGGGPPGDRKGIVGGADGRGYAIGVGDARRRIGRAVRRAIEDRGRAVVGDVARRHQRGDDQPQRSLVGREALDEADLDGGLFAREQVADAGREDVG